MEKIFSECRGMIPVFQFYSKMRTKKEECHPLDWKVILKISDSQYALGLVEA